MTYKDLKDGMICTLRDGKKYMVFKDWMYEFKENKVSGGHDFIHWGKTFQWNKDELKMFGNQHSSDIMKVEYDGKIIWERVEYVSFMDAVNSEKKFKHKDWNYYLYLCEALEFMSEQLDSDVEEIMNKKEWIIEQ